MGLLVEATESPGFHHPVELLPHLARACTHRRIVDHIEYRPRVHEFDVYCAGRVLAHADVTRQQKTDRRFRFDGAKGERWIARAEDPVRRSYSRHIRSLCRAFYVRAPADLRASGMNAGVRAAYRR